MIEVIIRHKGSKVELARIEIENLTGAVDEADYSVRFGVERGTGVGLHRRMVQRFPRMKYNVLALIKQALATLEEDELKLDTPHMDVSKMRKGNILRGMWF